MLLAPSSDLPTSCSVISGKGRDVFGTAKAVRGMSPTSAAFCRRFLASTSLFASNKVAEGLGP